ncbi:MAG: PLP-dependent aspartate aminotransferase family protein [Methanomassiliicoccales archaeon]
MSDHRSGFATKAIHEGEGNRTKQHADVVSPIHLTSTFARRKVDQKYGDYEYSRGGNPTRTALESKLAAIEGGNGAIALSSGMAAESVVLFLLKAGSRVIVGSDIYGGSYRLFDKCFSRFNIKFEYVDLRNLDAFRGALDEKTDMIWMETPTNPLLRLYDIKAIGEIAHDRERGTLLVVDNTFASPFFQNPLALGADMVVHSTTKYISGHSDVLGGAVIADNDELLTDLRLFQKAVGPILSPFDSYLTLRGLKTLHLRMERHQENALAIADHLERHPLIKTVNYPGLPYHPQHKLAKQQMSGFSGMLSFEVAPGINAAKVAESTELFALAESLGGVESLIEYPSSMTHRTIPPAKRREFGLTDELVRISIGVEDKADLIADLDQALVAGSADQ